MQLKALIGMERNVSSVNTWQQEECQLLCILLYLCIGIFFSKYHVKSGEAEAYLLFTFMPHCSPDVARMAYKRITTIKQ